MQKTWRSHLLLAYSLVILAFLYLPLLILALYSFNESRINAVWTGFTLDWYKTLFQNRRVLEALMNSLFIAGGPVLRWTGTKRCSKTAACWRH